VGAGAQRPEKRGNNRAATLSIRAAVRRPPAEPEGAFNATLFIDALQANGPFSAGWPSRRRSPAAPVARGPRTGGGRFWGTRSACAANQDLATLVPNARFFVAKDSGHDVHQDQPELVIEAIRQVVAGVRNPDTWYDLASCCAN
jgi:pimeloyl-ACP methyl ester carboxylesterase